MNVVTERQESFIRSLWEQVGREGDAEVPEDRRDASALIEELLAEKASKPRVPVQRTKASFTPVPEGYYAVEWRDVLRFYAVREGTGQWAGRTFLNRFKSDDELRVGRDEYRDVMAMIRADVEGCRARFAAETVRCFSCARRLTDEYSRSVGQGPDCRSR